MMRLVKNSFVPLLLAFISCGSTNQIPVDYSGRDAGRVIVGLGTADPIESYALLFRETRVAEPAVPRTGEFRFTPSELVNETNGIYGTATAGNDSERGIVRVLSLPAGEYELYNVRIEPGEGSRTRFFRKHFSVKFLVAPGETTYLANFQANSFRRDGRTTVFFVVDDRFHDDVEIAREVSPSLGNTISNQAITASQFDSLHFIRPNQKVSYPR